jgi:hypothetical protein
MADARSYGASKMKGRALDFIDFLDGVRKERGQSIQDMEFNATMQHGSWRQNTMNRKAPSLHRTIQVCKAVSCRLVVSYGETVLNVWDEYKEAKETELELVVLADNAREREGHTRCYFETGCGMGGGAWNKYVQGLNNISTHKYIAAVYALGFDITIARNEDA